MDMIYLNMLILIYKSKIEGVFSIFLCRWLHLRLKYYVYETIDIIVYDYLKIPKHLEFTNQLNEDNIKGLSNKHAGETCHIQYYILEMCIMYI